MKIRVTLADGGALEFDHDNIQAVCDGLMRATERVIRLEDALRACHHELTTHHGLWAHDGDAALAWRLDCLTVLAQAQALLPVGQEANR